MYRGESRVLREQLRVSEITRKSLYDDKCELEEAENDARLMVQRYVLLDFLNFRIYL